MKTNCILIVSGEKPEDVSKFEALVKANLSPAENGLCLSFLHNPQNQNLTKFDEVVNKKKPGTLLFWGASDEQFELLAKRGLKKIPGIKIFSNRKFYSVSINVTVIQKITNEELQVFPKETAAVA